MKTLFIKYASIGVINTLLHWLIFFLGVALIGLTQATANFLAFLVAVTFSFFMNAKFTFKAEPTGGRYLIFILFMGGLSYLIGYMGDRLDTYPIVTLVLFSSLSLVLGFIYSKFIVFK